MEQQDNALQDLPFIPHKKTTIKWVEFFIWDHAIITIAGFEESFEWEVTDIENHIIELNGERIELNNCVWAKKVDLSKEKKIIQKGIDSSGIDQWIGARFWSQDLQKWIDWILDSAYTIEDCESLLITIRDSMIMLRKDLHIESKRILEIEEDSSWLFTKQKTDDIARIGQKIWILGMTITGLNKKIDEIKAWALSRQIQG